MSREYDTRPNRKPGVVIGTPIRKRFVCKACGIEGIGVPGQCWHQTTECQQHRQETMAANKKKATVRHKNKADRQATLERLGLR